jgi:hypothetical protein
MSRLTSLQEGRSAHRGVNPFAILFCSDEGARKALGSSYLVVVSLFFVYVKRFRI